MHLKNEYKNIKDINKQAGKGYKEWKYFELLDKILGSCNTVQSPCIVERMPNNASDANAGLENAVNDHDLTQVDNDVTQIENSLSDNDLIQVDGLTQVDGDFEMTLCSSLTWPDPIFVQGHYRLQYKRPS